MCDVLQSLREQLDDIENETKSEQTKANELYKAAEPCLHNMPLEVTIYIILKIYIICIAYFYKVNFFQIILKICTYLEADFIKNTLSKVCTRFEAILTDVSLWKHRVNCKIKGLFPPMAHLEDWNEDVVDWTKMCIEMENEKYKWCNVDTTTKHLVIKDLHYASVDAVILVNASIFLVISSYVRIRKQ